MNTKNSDGLKSADPKKQESKLDQILAEAAVEDPVARFFYENQKLILTVLVVALVLILGSRWYQNQHLQSQQRSAELMFKIDQALDQLNSSAVDQSSKAATVTKLDSAAKTLQAQNYPYNLLAQHSQKLAELAALKDLNPQEQTALVKSELDQIDLSSVFSSGKEQLWQELYALYLNKIALDQGKLQDAAIKNLKLLAENSRYVQLSAYTLIQARAIVSGDAELEKFSEEIKAKIVASTPELLA